MQYLRDGGVTERPAGGEHPSPSADDRNVEPGAGARPFLPWFLPPGAYGRRPLGRNRSARDRPQIDITRPIPDPLITDVQRRTSVVHFAFLSAGARSQPPRLNGPSPNTVLHIHTNSI